MSFLDLTNDGIILVAETLHKEPLLGLLAVYALHRCNQNLHQLLRGFVAEQPELRRSGCCLSTHWITPCFTELRKMPRHHTVRSPSFSTAFGHSFRFLLFPNGNKSPDYVSLYIEVSDNLFFGWRRNTTFTIRAQQVVGLQISSRAGPR